MTSYFYKPLHLIFHLSRKKSPESSLSPWQPRGPGIPPSPQSHGSSPGPCVLLLLPSLQEVQRVSWYWLPCTLVTFPCCSQSWCGWHGLVLESEEEKKPRGQARHWVFSKGVPAHGEARGPLARGDKLAKERGRSWGRCRQSEDCQTPFEHEGDGLEMIIACSSPGHLVSSCRANSSSPVISQEKAFGTC